MRSITRLAVLPLMVALATGCAAAVAAADSEAAVDEVTVREQPVTLPWYTSEPQYKTNPRAGGALWAKRGTEQRDGERTFESVVLENRFLRVQVLPEAGGAVKQAVYKPTDTEMFFFEGKAKDWLPFWESGVKVSFPFREHCVRMEGQEASWRVVEHDDGSKTLAMWMEFSRHNDPWEATHFGAYATMVLSQHITLRPDENRFSITYRLTNATGYRQGRRLWTDAFLPRFHTEEEGVVHGKDTPPQGPTQTEWIFPAAYIADHRGLNVRELTEQEIDIAASEESHNSIFALDTAAGFVGAYYPGVKVNRLRLGDPAEAPGTKLYWQGEGGYDADSLTAHMYNFLELWGGSDHIMEGVEHWIEPGHTYTFTHDYTMTTGIGRADYANEHAVVHLNTDDGVLEVITLRPIEQLEAELDGESLGDTTAAAPDKPARFDLPEGVEGGRLLLRDRQQVLIDRTLPIEPEGNPDDHDRIVAKSDLNWAEGSERIGYQMDYGRQISNAIRNYGAGTLGRGRVEYRLGHVDRAIETLSTAVEDDPSKGEAWHLLGMARLEQEEREDAMEAFDRAIDAEAPYLAARYFKAIGQLDADDPAAAERSLDSLIDAQPGHWEARLLKTWVVSRDADRAGDALATAERLMDEAPADPRAAFVWHAAAKVAESDTARKRSRQALEQLLEEAGADRRLDEFKSATEGRFMPPKRIESFD